MIKMMLITLLCLLCLLHLCACTSFDSAMQSLNDRQVQGCYRAQITGGAGYGGQISGSAAGIVATGGVDMTTCAKILTGGI